MPARSTLPSLTSLLLASIFLAASAQASIFKKDATPEQQRAEIREIRDQTLAELFKDQPSARGVIENAAGYAVFSNFGVKILVAGGGTGKGLAVVNETGKETFMNVAEAQAGLGFGVKQFRLVWVFVDQADLDTFINSGWEIGAQATASAKYSDQGAEVYTGAISIKPGVWLYQLTDDGLALELTAKGTRYYKNNDLN
jgi:lipid-binding SYLF domain-containing protein